MRITRLRRSGGGNRLSDSASAGLDGRGTLPKPTQQCPKRCSAPALLNLKPCRMQRSVLLLSATMRSGIALAATTGESELPLSSIKILREEINLVLCSMDADVRPQATAFSRNIPASSQSICCQHCCDLMSCKMPFQN